MYKRRLAFQPASGAEWVARVLTPQTPSEPGTYASANMTISDEHPATARGSGSVADVTDSGRPFINVELRAQANGELHLVLTDSNGSVTYEDPSNPGTPFDLRTFGVIDNTYLTVQPQAGGTYEVRFKTNMNPGNTDIVVDTGRAVPVGLTSGWLSLRAEVSNAETAEHDARFDEVFVTSQPDGADVEEEFGGTALNIQVPAGFDAQPVATGLTAPTAIEFTDDGTMFISERRGTVQMRKPDGTISQVLNISGDVNAPVFVDQGLLGFVLDPGFVGNGGRERLRLLLVHAKAGAGRDAHGLSRGANPVERDRRLIPPRGPCLSARTIRRRGSGDTCPPAPSSDCLPSDAYTHSAGGLAFGSDGKLWISVPDGASPEGPDPGGKDPLALRAQNPNSLAGKLLRVDPATGNGVLGNPGFNMGTPRTLFPGRGSRASGTRSGSPSAPAAAPSTSPTWAGEPGRRPTSSRPPLRRRP